MKYLKKYNESENSLQSFFKPLINNELIEELKYLTVNALDKEWLLYLSVRCDGLNGQRTGSHLQNEIMRLVYGMNHNSEFLNTNLDKFRREYKAGQGHQLYDVYEEYEKNGLNYVFSINKRISHEMASINLDISEQILDDIKSLYPNEKIDLDIDFYDAKKENNLFDIDTKTIT